LFSLTHQIDKEVSMSSSPDPFQSYSDSHEPRQELNSPFLNEEYLVEEARTAQWRIPVPKLKLESPFLKAFEEGWGARIEPEAEELHKEFDELLDESDEEELEKELEEDEFVPLSALEEEEFSELDEDEESPAWAYAVAEPQELEVTEFDKQLADTPTARSLRPCISPIISSDDPTKLNLSDVGTDNFNFTLTIRGTSYEVKGNMFYPGQSSGARVPFNTRMVLKVFQGRAPIVFIAHGQHTAFYNPKERKDECGYNTEDCKGYLPIPSHMGYEYFQVLLAQMGIISVSVDCNEFNSRDRFTDPTNLLDRSKLVLEAIKYFQNLNSNRNSTFSGHIDFSSVGLMGHSRGGEAMLVVSKQLAQPNMGISNVTVKGILAIAPSDSCLTCGEPTQYGCPTGGSMPTGFAFMTILPAADADIMCSEGARFYDQASADPFKCQLYIHNANHNFFNAQWVSDDRDAWNTKYKTVIPKRLYIQLMSKDEHQAILKAYGCAFFRTVLHRPHSGLQVTEMRNIVEGLKIPRGVTRFQDVHISFERADSITVDNFEGSNIRRNSLGKTNSWAGGLTVELAKFARDVYPTFYGNTNGMLAWSSLKSGRFKWSLGRTMNLSGKEIRIRAAEVYEGESVPPEATGFKLGLADARNKRGFVDSDDVGGLPRPYDRRKDDLAIFGKDYTKTMFKTLRFPVACIVARAERGFDVTKIQAIVLHMDRNDKRYLAFDQLQIV
jgi:hypothetical protein